MKRFKLDAEQTDAVLELKVYRLARLEILIIRDELAEKKKRARQIGSLLRHEDRRWNLVRDELKEIQHTYASAKKDPRRTRIESVTDETEYSADDFIIEEDCVVLVSRDGWVKRQKEVRDVTTTRLREGDDLLAALAGSTRAAAVFFTNLGIAYTCRLIDVPASTGYGEPIQRLFKLKDGEHIVAALSLDPRVAPGISPRRAAVAPKTHALAISTDGFALRCSIEPFAEPSTRSGRRYARPSKNAEIIGVAKVDGSETIIAATKAARAILCHAKQIKMLSGRQGSHAHQASEGSGERRRGIGIHRLARTTRTSHGRNEPGRNSDDQHWQVRSQRTWRQRAPPAAAWSVHACRPTVGGRAIARR